jgi:transposase-like protein
MDLAKISKLQASKHCKGIDGRVRAFREVPMESDWPYLRPGATYLKPRESRSIVSVAGIVAVAVNSNGRPEIIGLKFGLSEAEAV